MSNESFGSIIRWHRERKGISLRGMASECGIDYTYLSKIERNVFPPPADRVIMMLSALLELDEDWLFRWADRVSPVVTGYLISCPNAVAKVRAMMKGDGE